MSWRAGELESWRVDLFGKSAAIPARPLPMEERAHDPPLFSIILYILHYSLTFSIFPTIPYYPYYLLPTTPYHSPQRGPVSGLRSREMASIKAIAIGEGSLLHRDKELGHWFPSNDDISPFVPISKLHFPPATNQMHHLSTKCVPTRFPFFDPSNTHIPPSILHPPWRRSLLRLGETQCGKLVSLSRPGESSFSPSPC